MRLLIPRISAAIAITVEIAITTIIPIHSACAVLFMCLPASPRHRIAGEHLLAGAIPMQQWLQVHNHGESCNGSKKWRGKEVSLLTYLFMPLPARILHG